MKPGESFVAQPVRSLQTMLRTISEDDGCSPSVVPDGIYGPHTTAAVSSFQRNHGLPITGVTDERTWDAIVDVYEPAMIRIGPAQPLQIILHPNEVIRRGDENINLYIVQAVLTVLSQIYGSPCPSQTGILDDATVDALLGFQQMHGLPQTGELDRITWKHLAKQFTLSAHHRKVFNVD